MKNVHSVFYRTKLFIAQRRQRGLNMFFSKASKIIFLLHFIPVLLLSALVYCDCNSNHEFGETVEGWIFFFLLDFPLATYLLSFIPNTTTGNDYLDCIVIPAFIFQITGWIHWTLIWFFLSESLRILLTLLRSAINLICLKEREPRLKKNAPVSKNTWSFFETAVVVFWIHLAVVIIFFAIWGAPAAGQDHLEKYTVYNPLPQWCLFYLLDFPLGVLYTHAADLTFAHVQWLFIHEPSFVCYRFHFIVGPIFIVQLLGWINWTIICVIVQSVIWGVKHIYCFCSSFECFQWLFKSRSDT